MVKWDNLAYFPYIRPTFNGTVLPRSIAPRFIAKPAYRQNSRLSRFPPLQIPRYTARCDVLITYRSVNVYCYF